MKNLFKGSLFTVGASLWWGVIGVIYFKFVSFASAMELTIHRTVWTALLLILTTSYYSKWNELKIILNKKVNILILMITGLLISINWYTWLFAVKSNNLLDAALGYYIFPILSIFFGVIFLKEKYNRNKIISVILVVIALIYLLIKLGEVPWIGITVAITFSLYGLIRKKVSVSSDTGLLIETLLLLPIALILFIFLIKNNTNVFSFNEPILSFYLFWAGVMTLVPLFWYTKGMHLIGIGPASMIFFLTPTAQFFLGLFYFNEPLVLDELISFFLIWIAVVIYLNELRKE
ncbi:MAG: protein RarD [Candidatus Pelagibacter sp.]|jgi:chloramphenicol-sensitive protein RarD|nr:protein RarD [Candidatus Pelagibacter sp.]|tara:strand:+ start:117 stop:986 length:870 start_codon:yes stop_codon:yes gene_type:complete